MQTKTVTSNELETLAQIRSLPSDQLHLKLKKETASEREILSKIVCYIYEVGRRKLYFKHGYTNLFEYLVKEMKYSNASAQRRLDAARILEAEPGLSQDLATGDITLTQVSIVAQGLKQAKRESQSFTSTVEVKRDLLKKVKARPGAQAQQIVAKVLNLEIKALEKKVVQRDESLRLEMTFTKEEAELLRQVKDLLSHTNPGANFKDTIIAALNQLMKRQDPARLVKAKKVEVTSAAEVRRSVFRRDKSCQWKYQGGESCGSTFQLQLDHKKSRWLGGSDSASNFQLLCSAHNKLKYQKEIGLL